MILFGRSMKKNLSESLKKEIFNQRKQGVSYGVLSSKFNIAKSTLHYWLSKLEIPEKSKLRSKENWLKIVQPMGAKANHQKRIDRLRKIEQQTIKEINENIHIKQSKKALLAMLYWAEGSKGRGDMVTFANTDPQLIKLFASLLRSSYKIDENKFRIRIHLHYYHNEKKVKKYWSALLDIPVDQFGKTYWKKRGTNKIYRKNAYGICFVRYNSLALKEEIMFYARNAAKHLVDE